MCNGACIDEQQAAALDFLYQDDQYGDTAKYDPCQLCKGNGFVSAAVAMAYRIEHSLPIDENGGKMQ